MDAPAEPVAGLRWRGLQWLAWSAVPLLGLVLALWIQRQPPQRDLFVVLNLWATALPDGLWSSLTVLGETDTLLVFMSLLLPWRPQALMAVVAAVPVGGLYSLVLKNAFNAPRPAAVLDAAQFHLIGPLLSNHSFPSGHSITAFAAASAVLACVVTPRATLRSALWVLLIVGVASAVGFSRVAVGAHWPVDVLAGACGGWLAGLSGAWTTRRFPALWQSVRNQRVLGGLLGALALWLLWRPADYPQAVLMVWLAAACALLTLIAQWRSKLATNPVLIE